MHCLKNINHGIFHGKGCPHCEQIAFENAQMDRDQEESYDATLPAVAGSFTDTPLNFERRALLCLSVVEDSISPDVSLRAVLCDAVRMARMIAEKG